MATIVVKLNRNSSIYQNLEYEIQQYLSSLETVNFSTQKLPPEPGTLGEHEIVKFLIESGADILNFVTALILLYQQVKALGGEPKEQVRADEDKEDAAKDMIIEVKGQKLELPAGRTTEKRFVKDLGSDRGKVGNKVSAKTKARKSQKTAKGTSKEKRK